MEKTIVPKKRPPHSGTAAFRMYGKNGITLEIKVALAFLDALDALQQLVAELLIHVHDIVLNHLPAFGSHFGRGVIDQVLA